MARNVLTLRAAVLVAAAVAILSLTLAVCGCARPGSTGASGSTSGTAANAAANEAQVRQVVQQLYGAMTTERFSAVRQLLTGAAASYPATTWQRDMTLVVGMDVPTVKVTGTRAEVTVVERVKDKEGNAGVTQSHYVLAKTSVGWKIASAQFGD